MSGVVANCTALSFALRNKEGTAALCLKFIYDL
jgi:hypothetical protein